MFKVKIRTVRDKETVRKFTFRIRDLYNKYTFDASAKASSVEEAKAKIKDKLVGYANMIILHVSDDQGATYYGNKLINFKDSECTCDHPESECGPECACGCKDENVKDSQFLVGNRVLHKSQNERGTVQKIYPNGNIYVKWDGWIRDPDGHVRVASEVDPKIVNIEKIYDSTNSIVKDSTFYYILKKDYGKTPFIPQNYINANSKEDAEKQLNNKFGMGNWEFASGEEFELRNVDSARLLDGVEVSHDNVREEPIYVLQSDVDKNLYAYIGKTHIMKEGEWSYTQYRLNEVSPESVKSQMLASGWHQVQRGPAPFIDSCSVKDEYAFVEGDTYTNKNGIKLTIGNYTSDGKINFSFDKNDVHTATPDGLANMLKVNNYIKDKIYAPVVDAKPKYTFLVKSVEGSKQIDANSEQEAVESYKKMYPSVNEDDITIQLVKRIDKDDYIGKLISENRDSKIKDGWSGTRNGIIYSYNNGKWTITHKNGKVETFPDEKFNSDKELYAYIDTIKDDKYNPSVVKPLVDKYKRLENQRKELLRYNRGEKSEKVENVNNQLLDIEKQLIHLGFDTARLLDDTPKPIDNIKDEQVPIDEILNESENIAKQGIVAELNTTNDYQSWVNALKEMYNKTQDEKYLKAAEAVADINREEKVHAGEFSQVLANLNPENGEAVQEGMEEVREEDSAVIHDGDYYTQIDMVDEFGGVHSIIVKANNSEEAKNKAVKKYPKWKYRNSWVAGKDDFESAKYYNRLWIDSSIKDVEPTKQQIEQYAEMHGLSYADAKRALEEDVDFQEAMQHYQYDKNTVKDGLKNPIGYMPDGVIFPGYDLGYSKKFLKERGIEWDKIVTETWTNVGKKLHTWKFYNKGKLVAKLEYGALSFGPGLKDSAVKDSAYDSDFYSMLEYVFNNTIDEGEYTINKLVEKVYGNLRAYGRTYDKDLIESYIYSNEGSLANKYNVVIKDKNLVAGDVVEETSEPKTTKEMQEPKPIKDKMPTMLIAEICKLGVDYPKFMGDDVYKFEIKTNRLDEQKLKRILPRDCSYSIRGNQLIVNY